MPNCYMLRNIETGKPDKFTVIDEFLCEKLDQPIDDELWVGDWENAFGLSWACGKSFDDCRNRLAVDDELRLDILDVLEQHYTIEAWHERSGFR